MSKYTQVVIIPALIGVGLDSRVVIAVVADLFLRFRRRTRAEHKKVEAQGIELI
jgi:hypothetical protein